VSIERSRNGLLSTELSVKPIVESHTHQALREPAITAASTAISHNPKGAGSNPAPATKKPGQRPGFLLSRVSALVVDRAMSNGVKPILTTR
jgi:hypothetical protein